MFYYLQVPVMFGSWSAVDDRLKSDERLSNTNHRKFLPYPLKKGGLKKVTKKEKVSGQFSIKFHEKDPCALIEQAKALLKTSHFVLSHY